MKSTITRETVWELAQAAIAAGAVDAYDDCVGGAVRAPTGASKACVDAVERYRAAARELDAHINGPQRAYYYFGR